MNITTIGIDLAKNTFSLHNVDAHGKACWGKKVSRKKLPATLADPPPCLIGIETCSGAHYWHYWAREIGKLGHEARVMAPKLVTPYLKGSKTTITMLPASVKPSRVRIFASYR